MSVPLNLLRSRLFRRSAAVLLLAVAVVACIGTPKDCDPSSARCRAKAESEITGSIRPAAGVAITVRRGDTVDDIARRHGVPVSAILEANRLPDRASVWAGQRLVVPL